MSFRAGRRMGRRTNLFTIVLILPCLIWWAYVGYKHIDYNRCIAGYLKRAADSNTIALAEKELNTALVEIERRGWTKGSTHIIYSTPSTDVGFWYENLKSSHNELVNLSPEASQLERTNVLMKLRETILDGNESVSVTAPYGIALFPNHVSIVLVGCLVMLIAGIGFIIIFLNE